ncbi:MAG: hypothetical protein ACFE0J_14640 [Elainellaceae cyanobacterium]
MGIVSGKTVLERIKDRAITKWGEENWLLEIVREYCNLSDDPKATVRNRKPQIQRAFEVGSCTLDTAIVLAAAVGCRFQMACVSIEVEEF